MDIHDTLSLYPNDGGFLNKHRDGDPKIRNQSLIHFKLELTHKFKDYEKEDFLLG